LKDSESKDQTQYMGEEAVSYSTVRSNSYK